MTVLFKILSVIGVAFLILLIIALWLILTPRHFWVEYSKRDGLIAQVNIAFFRFTLYPVPEFLRKILVKKKSEDKRNTSEAGRGEKTTWEMVQNLCLLIFSSLLTLSDRRFHRQKE